MRYFLAPLAGDGTDSSPYRPDLPAGVGMVALLASNPDGTPRYLWCLVLVSAANYSALEADSRVFALPLTPETLMSSVPQNQRSAYTTALRKFVPGVSIVWTTDTAADVIDRIAVYAEPAWQRGGMRWGGQ
jgi:hypothetical protein